MYKGIIAVSFFKKEDYPEILRISEDADNMFETWEEWHKSARQHTRNMESQGMKVVDILVIPTELFIYCKENELPINGKARAQYANEKSDMLKWRK